MAGIAPEHDRGKLKDRRGDLSLRLLVRFARCYVRLELSDARVQRFIETVATLAQEQFRSGTPAEQLRLLVRGFCFVVSFV